MENNKLFTENKVSQEGVYKHQCNDYNCFYIGQTGRMFDIRFKENMYSLRLRKKDSIFANQLENNNHSCDISNLKKLYTVSKNC